AIPSTARATQEGHRRAQQPAAQVVEPRALGVLVLRAELVDEGVAIRALALADVEVDELGRPLGQGAAEPGLQDVRVRAGDPLLPPHAGDGEGEALVVGARRAHRAPGFQSPRNSEWFGSLCRAIARSFSIARNLMPATSFSSAMPK